jgi:hypothetical protein
MNKHRGPKPPFTGVDAFFIGLAVVVVVLLVVFVGRAR